MIRVISELPSLRVRCDNCLTLLGYDKSDVVSLSTANGSVNVIYCPYCKVTIFIEPTKQQPWTDKGLS